MNSETTGSQDLRTVLRMFWRWKWLFLASLVLLPLGAYIIESRKPPEYASSTLIQLSTASSSTSSVTPSSAATVAALVDTNPIIRLATRYLREDGHAGIPVGEVSASADPTTGFITVSASAADPVWAARLAQAYARALGAYSVSQANAQVQSQINSLTNQLAAIPNNAENAISRAALVAQVTSLREQLLVASAGAQVLNPATVNTTPTGPKTRRAVELGLLIGLLAGIGAVLLAESVDHKLRRPDDLEGIAGRPLIGVVPSAAFAEHGITDPKVQAACEMIESSLMNFNAGHPLRSVAVVSPVMGDGKTTLAIGVAIAGARAGRRVTLIDADLRRPRVLPRLGLEASEGLVDVLVDEREMHSVLLDYPLEKGNGGELQILPAGEIAGNPSAVLASDRMRELLRACEQEADLVVVDTSAALAVGDALPLLRYCSGVLLTVRMSRSSSPMVRRVLQVIAAAGGQVAGVVATGVDAVGDEYGYGYTHTYADDAGGAVREKRRLTAVEAANVRAKRGTESGTGAAEPRPEPEPVAEPEPEPESVAEPEPEPEPEPELTLFAASGAEQPVPKRSASRKPAAAKPAAGKPAAKKPAAAKPAAKKPAATKPAAPKPKPAAKTRAATAPQAPRSQTPRTSTTRTTTDTPRPRGWPAR